MAKPYANPKITLNLRSRTGAFADNEPFDRLLQWAPRIGTKCGDAEIVAIAGRIIQFATRRTISVPRPETFEFSGKSVEAFHIRFQLKFCV